MGADALGHWGSCEGTRFRFTYSQQLGYQLGYEVDIYSLRHI